MTEVIETNPLLELAEARLKALLAVRAEFEAFKEQVREKAIEVAASNGWCDEGLNEVLKELGLEPKTRSFNVIVRVYGFQDVEVEIDEAANWDDAREQALNMDLDTSSYGWEQDNDIAYPEVQDIEQA